MAMKSNLNTKFIPIFESSRVEIQKKTFRLSTVQDVIDLSGGAKVLKSKINLIRLKHNGELEKLKLSLKKERDEKNNAYLKSREIIYIRKSPFNITSESLGEILVRL